ncbi:AraC family transcriptional regulator [Streptomonospora sp. PA3]|uniref:AraC family transcriptional regulator n=1 Tax=Streptomonospora sp. PA3 TaxID=2607326 RepID=UPI0012DD702B|nr:AraC family transcriptional regulator [Streptomonospora sp. PA3]MUL44305.1 AraC family transcriptional regulator [Streptomonospora sp. PA3]
MDTETDLLSELLAPLRLRGVFYSRWSARAPWGVAGDGEDCALLHYVHRSECAVEMPDGTALRLAAGDLAVFPHGTAHRVADRPGRAAVALSDLLPRRPPGAVRAVEIGGSGPAALVLCGGLHYDRAAAAPLYRGLPPVLVLEGAAVAREPLLADTLRRLAEGSAHTGPGGRLVALRAFELVFVLALRGAIGADPPLMRALGDPVVRPGLLAVQTRFAEPWTVRSLAAEAGVGRSLFAARFRSLVGQAPMSHLTQRRMQEAARLLTETSLPQEQVARRVGFASATGFHLAFRRAFGATPGEYRRRGGAPDPGGGDGPRTGAAPWSG